MMFRGLSLFLPRCCAGTVNVSKIKQSNANNLFGIISSFVLREYRVNQVKKSTWKKAVDRLIAGKASVDGMI